MKLSHDPRRMPAWLRSQPVLLATVLTFMNRWQRFVGELRTPHGAAFVFSIGLGILAALTGAISSGAGVSVFNWLVEYAPMVAVVVGVHTLLEIGRRRQRAAEANGRSWLSATPGAAAVRSRTTLAQVAAPLAAQLAGAVSLVALIAVAASAPFDAVAMLFGWTLGGAALGATIGALRRLPTGEGRAEASRYVARARSTSGAATLRGLSRWPVLQAVSWFRPENARVLFMLAAVSVPLGSSALLGLAIVAFWTLASYMATLLYAVSQVAREASLWLRATPLRFAQFAWAISRRALVHQFIGTSLVSATLFAMGTPLTGVLRVAALWLAIVVLVATIALAEAFRARPPGLRIAFLVSATVATDYRAPGWALPLAAVIGAFHLRGAVTHARS